MAIFRSPVAHAEIIRLDSTDAATMPGVVSVLKATDADISNIKPMNCRAKMTGSNGEPMREPDRPVLARDKIMHLGEPLAAVVAETPDAAQSAAEAIRLEYNTLPAVTNVEEAQQSETQLWPEIDSNIAFTWEKGNIEDTDKQFASAPHVFELKVQHPRISIAPVEPRSCLAEYSTSREQYTLHTPSQGVISLQRSLSGYLGIDKSQLRVITRDVGGSFAVKIWPYAEQLLALVAAKRTGRPIKWTATRSESFLSDVMGRGRVDHAKLALDNNGRMLAFRIYAQADMGAYLNAVAPFVVTSGAVRPFSQCYDIPALHYQVDALYTNTMTTDAYRGAGKPESSNTLERIIEFAATQLNIDPLEIRERNLIRPEQLPYKTPMEETYD